VRRRSSGALRRVTAHAEFVWAPRASGMVHYETLRPRHRFDTKLAMVVGWVLRGGAIMAHVVFWLVALIAAALTGPMGFTVVIAAWIGFKRPLRTLARQFVEHAPFAS
jgi:hypothetical protein